ncbi:uncharacterized protein sb:cb288 isoform X1 [Erpetoichthys calabaricus]|uniref:uncharacterized protein sb:cb288 isoform X1 n=1 Tax=Erpetoichthys calabaricus TaxID=27687 RepID=UPI00223460AC|nr:uncharacterized protein sb:cb288 isoform X1 [Erpetoichthys calabaricus]
MAAANSVLLRVRVVRWLLQSSWDESWTSTEVTVMSLNSSGTRSALQLLQSSSQDPAWRSLGLSGISNGSTEYTEWLPTKPTSSKDEMARGSGIIPGFLVNTPVTETVFIQRARVRNDKLRWGTTLVILVEFSKAFLNFKINGHCMAQI